MADSHMNIEGSEASPPLHDPFFGTPPGGERPWLTMLVWLCGGFCVQVGALIFAGCFLVGEYYLPAKALFPFYMLTYDRLNQADGLAMLAFFFSLFQFIWYAGILGIAWKCRVTLLAALPLLAVHVTAVILAFWLVSS